MKTIGALVAGMLLVMGPSLGTEAKVDLHVSPTVATAPATLRIEVTVAPDAANRAVAIVADGEGFFRSSEVPLEGENARRTVLLEYR